MVRVMETIAWYQLVLQTSSLISVPAPHSRICNCKALTSSRTVANEIVISSLLAIVVGGTLHIRRDAEKLSKCGCVFPSNTFKLRHADKQLLMLVFRPC